MFASVDKALDERTIGHNPERLNLLKGGIIYSNKVGSMPAFWRPDLHDTHHRCCSLRSVDLGQTLLIH